MKVLYRYLLLVVFCALISPANAWTSSNDVVYLKNGSIIRGTIVELVPGSIVKITTSDGSLFVYNMDDVIKIEKAKVNTPVQNSYAMHRNIARWGFASTLTATFVGSLAMNDAFFATTVIPVVGPFITITRIEDDPDANYLPGAKPLLIASGVAQTGFLIYYLASLVGEKSHNERISLLPSSDLAGITMQFRF